MSLPEAKLPAWQNPLIIKMLSDLTVDDVFHDLAGNRCQRDRAVIFRLVSVCFLKMGETFADFHC